MRGATFGRVVADRYRLLETIGAGAFGEVHLAEDSRLATTVAIKFLRPSVAKDPRMKARFEREARATSRIRHPNVVVVSDCGEEPELGLFLVMERLRGETLRERLDRAGAPERGLSIGETLRISGQIASAIAAAHDAGVLHRDLKPANVMLVAQEGQPAQAKVLDFGVAGLVDDSEQHLTATGISIGTPQYMAPDASLGGRVGPSADIYSLGIMLYEMTTGRLPFTASTASGLLVKHATENPLPPSAFQPPGAIPEALEKLILRCLAKKPAERPASMAALGSELRAMSDWAARDLRAVPTPLRSSEVWGDTELAPQPPASQTTGDEKRRAPAWLLAGLAFLSVGLALVLAFVLTRTPDSAPAAPARLAATEAPLAPSQPPEPAVSPLAPLPSADTGPPTEADTSAEPVRDPLFAVRVESSPQGAMVVEGELDLGETPLVLHVRRSDPPRQLTLTLAGYRTRAATVDPESLAQQKPDERSMSVELRPAPRKKAPKTRKESPSGGLLDALPSLTKDGGLAKAWYRCTCEVKGRPDYEEKTCSATPLTAQVEANSQCESRYGFTATGTWDACRCHSCRSAGRSCRD